MNVVQKYVGDQPRAAFTARRYKDLSSQVRRNSEFWRSVFFTASELQGAPGPDVEVGIYLARSASEHDLLQYVVPKDEGAIRLVENGGSITLQVRAIGGVMARARKRIEEVVRLDGIDPVRTYDPASPVNVEIDIPWPRKFRNGMWVQSDGSPPWPWIGSWSSRLDVWGSPGMVNVTLYKVSGLQAMMGLPPRDGWLRTEKSTRF